MDDSCEQIKAKRDAAEKDYHEAQAFEWECRRAHEKANDDDEDKKELFRAWKNAESKARQAEVVLNGWRRAYDDCV